MLAISQDKVGIGGGNYVSAGQFVTHTSQNMITDHVKKSSEVAAAVKDPLKSNIDVVKVSDEVKNISPDVSQDTMKEFPPNYLKEIGKEFPPDVLRKAYEAYKMEFPEDILKKNAEAFPGNFLEELNVDDKLKAPDQSAGIERQAILAYSSNEPV